MAKGPKFIRYFGPVLSALKKLGGSGRPSEVRELVAQELHISEAEQAELLSSGTPRFDNQVAFARFYLSKAGYIESSQRGVWTLTEKGAASATLTEQDALKLFKDVHVSFVKRRADKQLAATTEPGDEEIAPSEVTTDGGGDYKEELIATLKSLPAAGFERFCQRLLRESGFEQVVVIGRSGDGGIDGHGILQVNPFVSFKVSFQCKRYVGAVGPNVVRDFRGAMMGRADKGIILTTGTFTPDAKREAVRDGVPAIDLVDVEKLLQMLQNLELGLNPRRRIKSTFGSFWISKSSGAWDRTAYKLCKVCRS